MKSISNQEEEHQVLQTKLAYLNGYLDALSIVSSYAIVGMEFELFVYNNDSGDINKTIQSNAYDLFGVYPDEWTTELVKTTNWEEQIKTEMTANFNRRIPHHPPETAHRFNYEKNDLVEDLFDKIRFAIQYFILRFKEEFETDQMEVYELKVYNTSHYRIVGIDLVFKISESKVLVMQLLGND